MLALTASSLEEERVLTVAAGCDDYLRKPFRERDLLELMAHHLGVRYLYAEPAAPPSAAPAARAALIPAALAALPAALRGRLRSAAVRAEMGEVEQLLGEVRAYDAALAAALAELADAFEYRRIADLLRDEG